MYQETYTLDTDGAAASTLVQVNICRACLQNMQCNANFSEIVFFLQLVILISDFSSAFMEQVR